MRLNADFDQRVVILPEDHTWVPSPAKGVTRMMLDRLGDEVARATSVEEVNALLKTASETYLKDILGYETRPLVSSDFCGNPLSSIVDALSTMVVNDTLVKIYAWYDNEWGYANRTVELAKLVGLAHSSSPL